MRKGNEIRKIALLLKEELKLDSPIYIRVRPMKRTIASISHRTGIISLNRSFIDQLDEEELKFVLAHELLHLKYGHAHSIGMRKELMDRFTPEVEERVMKKVREYVLDRLKTRGE